MDNYKEKRKFERVDYQTPKMMYKKGAKDVYENAIMTNYCPGGMYLKTQDYLDIGQQIIIKMNNYDPLSTGPEKYDYYYGKVRWIRHFHSQPYDSSYGYGIEYDQPVMF